nr:RNA-directed DNA polymerase, eukaryota [Tanacetum cinerariifolium]
MNIISINIQGLGNKTKKGWIQELSVKHKLNFIAIQETKMESVSYMDVKAMWGNSNFDFVCSDSQRNSGGILCIWEMSVFRKDHVTISDSFIAIYGTWLPTNSKLLLVSIYAPQQAAYKWVLWEYMLILLGRWNGDAILMGDFNEVHSREERQRSCFNPYSATVFDNFISSSGLVDIKMEVCLNRHLSDHRPILLHEVHVDFGPTPFRDQMDGSKRVLIKELRDVDKDLNQGVISDYLIFKRHEVTRQLQDIKSREAADFIQKSKVRWAIEGDENSKYFHGIINKKRSQLAIRGVFVDGIWRDDPSSVKEAFFNHYAARFKKPLTHGLKLYFFIN